MTAEEVEELAEFRRDPEAMALIVGALDCDIPAVRWQACASLRCLRYVPALGRLEELASAPPDEWTGKLAARAANAIRAKMFHDLGEGRC